MHGQLLNTLNGSDVYLRVFDNVGGQWLNIGGQVSHSVTLNNAVIDITNKLSESVRELLHGEGTQTLDVTAEFVFSNDAAFKFVRDAARLRQIKLFQVWRGMGDVDELAMMITSFAETANDGAATTASISFQSSEQIMMSVGYEFFYTTPEGQFNVNGDIPFLVRT